MSCQKQRYILSCILFREAVMTCAYVQKKSTGLMSVSAYGLSGAKRAEVSVGTAERKVSI